MKREEKPKIIAIVGPTAVGKTSFSLILAEKLGAEIVSADSRQVYRGLDIGSGKATSEERSRIPHHLLDVAEPDDVFTAADFVRLGREAIADIARRGKVPLLVGGTGFYIDALIGTVSLADVPPNAELRETLQGQAADELYARLREEDHAAANRIDSRNPVRLIRALEIIEALGEVPASHPEALYDVLSIGLTLPNEMLKQRIHERLADRLDAGMLNEAKRLHAEGVSYERMETLGLEYRYMARHLEGMLSYQEMKDELDKEIWRYAKRQMTWFKRNTSMLWIAPDERETAFAKAEAFLSV